MHSINYRFSDLQSVKAAVRLSIERWQRQASYRFTATCDQDFPNELYLYSPARLEATPAKPPLVLIGGMGPLAGIRAFERACETFSRDRIVLLYQACSVPDRSEIIRRLKSTGSPAEYALLVNELVRAISLATDQIRAEYGRRGPNYQQSASLDCVLVCNSVHYFLPLLRRQLRRTAVQNQPRIKFHSMVDAVAKRLANHPLVPHSKSSIKPLHYSATSEPPILLCGTEGTHLGETYSKALRKKGVPYLTPHNEAQASLLRAIYRGVKAFDSRIAVESGLRFLRIIKDSGLDLRGILAACTEIPLLFDLLSKESKSTVSGLLSPWILVDPVQCVFQRIRAGSKSKTDSKLNALSTIGAEG